MTKVSSQVAGSAGDKVVRACVVGLLFEPGLDVEREREQVRPRYESWQLGAASAGAEEINPQLLVDAENSLVSDPSGNDSLRVGERCEGVGNVALGEGCFVGDAGSVKPAVSVSEQDPGYFGSASWTEEQA